MFWCNKTLFSKGTFIGAYSTYLTLCSLGEFLNVLVFVFTYMYVHVRGEIEIFEELQFEDNISSYLTLPIILVFKELRGRCTWLTMIKGVILSLHSPKGSIAGILHVTLFVPSIMHPCSILHPASEELYNKVRPLITLSVPVWAQLM